LAALDTCRRHSTRSLPDSAEEPLAAAQPSASFVWRIFTDGRGGTGPQGTGARLIVTGASSASTFEDMGGVKHKASFDLRINVGSVHAKGMSGSVESAKRV